MALVLELKVIPNSKVQGFEKDSSGRVKCRLKSKPEGGRANEELIKLLAKKLDVSTDDIKLLRGATSRNKMIKIETQVSMQTALLRLGIEVQNKL